MRAQLDPPLGRTLAPYSGSRRARNAGDYLDELPARRDDVQADLPLCQAISQPEDPSAREARESQRGTGIASGLCIGVALGAAFHNIGLGVGLGLAIGAAIEASLGRRK